MKMKYAVEIVLLVISLTNFASCGVCPISTPTVTVVPRCPTTEAEMEKAAKRKKCEMMANTPNCDTPPVYHCLLNQWRNETVEVCTSPWYISGFCAIYDTVEMKVIDDFTRDCTKFSEGKCPTRYHSPEAFKYQNCYNETDDTSSQSLTNNQNQQFNDCPSSIPAIVIACVFSSIFAVYFILTQMGKMPIIVDRIKKERELHDVVPSLEKVDRTKKERELHRVVDSTEKVSRNTNKREIPDMAPLLPEEETKDDKWKVVYITEDIHQIPENKSAERGKNGFPGNSRIPSQNEPPKSAIDKVEDKSKDFIDCTPYKNVSASIQMFENKDNATSTERKNENHKATLTGVDDTDKRKQTDKTSKTNVVQNPASKAPILPINVENQEVHSTDQENSIEDHSSNIDDKECDRTPTPEHEHEETQDESSTTSEGETVQNTSEKDEQNAC